MGTVVYSKEVLMEFLKNIQERINYFIKKADSAQARMDYKNMRYYDEEIKQLYIFEQYLTEEFLRLAYGQSNSLK